jgi:hypothetical protein
MPDKFVVTGIPAFNGDYPIDMGTFSMREFNIIKRMSGVRAGRGRGTQERPRLGSI